MFEFDGRLIDQIKQDLGSPVIRFDTFAPQTEVDLVNASFQLADGRSYLIEDGQLGYRAWKTPRFVSNEEFMIEWSKKSGQRYLWRSTRKPIELTDMFSLDF